MVKRSNAYFGLHFDFHAVAETKGIGTKTVAENVGKYLDAVKPDYVQVDLHDRMDQENKAWPSIHTIEKDLSISRSTVKRAIKDLEKAELIRKEPHYRHNGSATSNRYYLL